MISPAISDMCLKLGLALLLGALIGIDRQLHHKPAGLRTMMLTCMGTTLFVLIAQVGLPISGNDPRPLTAEASRIIQGIVGGIGFLGAGVVLHSDKKVSNITTAATIWITAAIGAAVGLGLYPLACVAAGATFLTLTLVRQLERWLPSKHAEDFQEPQ